MTLVWLLVWLVAGTPRVELGHSLNAWAVALVICIVVDLLNRGSVLLR